MFCMLLTCLHCTVPGFVLSACSYLYNDAQKNTTQSAGSLQYTLIPLDTQTLLWTEPACPEAGSLAMLA